MPVLWANARSILRRFVWYVALLLLMPLIAATSWRDVVAHPVGLSYAVACVGLLLAFALKAPARRQATLLLLITLAVLKWLEVVSVGWDRIAVAGALITLVVIATEVVRQNITLIRDLKRQDARLAAKILFGAALWSPMLGLAWLGSLAGDWMKDTSIQWVYDQTPVDQHCRGEERPVPCEGLLAQPEPAIQKLSLQQNIEYHWRTIFRAKQQAMLQFIGSRDNADGIPDATFMHAKPLKAALDAIGAGISPESVLSIPKDSSLAHSEVLARDRELQNLIRRHDQLKRELKRPPVGLNGIIQRLRILPEAERTAWQIVLRRAALLATARRNLVSAQHLQGSVKLQLLRRFDTRAAPLPLADLLARKISEVPGVRAQLAALVVARLADSEKATLKMALDIAAKVSAMDATSRTRLPDAASQFAALGVLPLCSSQADSPDVYLDEDATRRARINTAPFACSEARLLMSGTLEPVGLAESLDLSVARWRQDAEAELEESTRQVLVGTLRRSTAAAADARELSAAVPMDIHLGRKRCRLLEIHNWGNCASNWAKARAEGTYRSARAGAQREYDLIVDDFKTGAQRSTAELVLYQRDRSLVQLGKAEAGLRYAIGTVTSFVDVLYWLLLLFLFVALIKSFLYVIALVVFDFHGPSLVQVEESAGVVGDSPRVASPGEGIKFTDIDQIPLVTKAHLDNQAVSIELAPWPTKCIVSRLLHFKYFAYNVGGPYTQGAIPEWQCPSGKNVVDWKLAPGEEVIFSYANFFGASKNVVLTRRISFRLSTMLLGRFTFHSARAEREAGHLLLLTNHISKESVLRDAIDAAAPERFIAWHAHTSFKVANALTVRSIFMDPFALVRVPRGGSRGRVLVEASSKSVAPFSGLFRYITRVLSPF